MKKPVLFIILFGMLNLSSYADRIYMMNSLGYNTAGAELITEITGNGHTVIVNNSTFILPAGFTSSCVDPVNGYDWLCFFGDNDFSPMLPQIQAFIDAGGKVFYQYEVSCCTQSSLSASIIASGLTGLPITENANAYIALDGSAQGGWEATNLGCCAPAFVGNAYKGMDGLPPPNQLNATANLNGSAPAISTCFNFGFVFTTTDFIGSANQGGLVGVGDINFWYTGGEPWSNGGSNPVDAALVDYLFPPAGSICHLLPPGCLQNYVNQSLVVDLGNDTTLCNGGALNLNATTAGATYIWQDNSTNPTFNVTTTGTYYVEVTNGCGVAYDTINVTFIAAPIIDLGNDTSFCPGDQLLLDATSAGATYLWQDNSTNPTFNVTTAGTYWVEVSVGSCMATDSINIVYGTSLTVDLGNDTGFCQGTVYQLNATTSGATYLWQDNSTNPTFNVSTSGTYWVEVTNTCGTTRDSIDISFGPIPVVDLGNDTSLCFGGNVLVDATNAGANYIWQDNTTAPTYNIIQTGLYWVQVNINGCIETDSIDVQFINLNLAQLGPDTTLCEGDIMVLDVSSAGATYLWQDNSTAATYNVNALGTYWVQVSNLCGSVTDSIAIDYQNCVCAMYIPNAFTPNLDELNQQFFPATSCTLVDYRFSIHDRWGKEIFVTIDPAAKWDGNINDVPVQIGVYVYRVSYQFDVPGSFPEVKIGHVSLLR